MKKNLLSSILVYVALAIAAATMIPFIDKTVGTNEILIKFVIFPVAVLAIAAFAAFVGKKQGTKASLRQGLYAGSVACVAYIAAVCVYAFTYALRASNIAGIIVSLVAACLFAFFGFKLNKVQEKLPVFCALAVMVFAAGGFATEITPSNWLVMMTFLLTLFLSFAKRRDDVVRMQKTGEAPRHNTERYNLTFINQAVTITASVTVVCYIMYTISPAVIQRTGSEYVYLTSVFVILGLLRYMQLTLVDEKSGDPTKMLYSDHFLQLVIAMWFASYLIIIYNPFS